jgi:hypothetical protein
MARPSTDSSYYLCIPIAIPIAKSTFAVVRDTEKVVFGEKWPYYHKEQLWLMYTPA